MTVTPAHFDPKDLPELPYESWKDTLATLHMWTQVVGKVRLELTPLVNHWWNVPLYVSARGLTTSAMPYANGDVEIGFDFVDHKLRIETSDGNAVELALKPESVAVFYQSVRTALVDLGVHVKIWTTPCHTGWSRKLSFTGTAWTNVAVPPYWNSTACLSWSVEASDMCLGRVLI